MAYCKIEDETKDYSWVLQANKKLSDYNEKTYMEQTFMPNATVAELSKEKFDKTFNEYKKTHSIYETISYARSNETKMPRSENYWRYDEGRRKGHE